MLHAQAEMGVSGAIPNPPIRFLPQEEIAAQACDNGCSNVHGWFSYKDHIVYLALDGDIYGNMYDRSILLHELVHYIQDRQGTPRMQNECKTWKAREAQAYEIQYRWLRRNGVPVRTPAYNVLLAGFESMNCDDT